MSLPSRVLAGNTTLVESLANPMAEPLAALAPAAEAVAGAVPRLPVPFNPLKLMLTSLGIPVEHLIAGSTKCIAELGPEAVGAVKTLLVTAPPSHPSWVSLPGCPNPRQGVLVILYSKPPLRAQGLWL